MGLIRSWIECDKCYSKLAVCGDDDEQAVLSGHQERSCYPAMREKIDLQAAEIELAEKEIKKLTDALRSLYDQQNGPPLIRDEKHWQEAMDKAAKCLGAKGDEEEESRV